MRLTENRRLAWVALAVCVVVSVFVLGGAALGRERKNVLRVFNDGTGNTDTRMSMDPTWTTWAKTHPSWPARPSFVWAGAT